jgi:hypothetical protein
MVGRCFLYKIKNRDDIVPSGLQVVPNAHASAESSSCYHITHLNVLHEVETLSLVIS